ncbi:hypothetical protein [Nocardia paucivorans]|uniref:hypothetical protein n=1 Tax=Nocardia paucivorans TaxID=114259 RepID=UPI0012F87103|nr:hypothetical protein [Nocardia paucivorans]
MTASSYRAAAGRVLAVAYLRTDLSGDARVLDEHRMKRLSVRFGYELCDFIRVDAAQVHRLMLLAERIRMYGAEAVFVPTVGHLDGQLTRVVAQADVIEQNGETYARWSPIAIMLGDLVFGRPVEGGRWTS